MATTPSTYVPSSVIVLDGEAGQLVRAVLRCGNTHASNGTIAILGRIVSRLREAWPSVEIEIRADAGFAVPAFYEYCQREGIDYTTGLITNPRLQTLAEPLLEEAQALRGPRGKVRLLAEGVITRRTLGAANGGLSTRRRRWRRAQTGALW